MQRMPKNPKIYHITHINNFDNILEQGFLWSDAERLKHGQECEIVGMIKIKKRRLEELEVKCHPGTKVGEYVPFNFCPRSVMLYILHKGNHPGLEYDQGQKPIIHLQADLRKAVSWAEKNDVQWAFTDINAGSFPAQYYKELEQLDNIDWRAVRARQWSDAGIREYKQAEFLVYRCIPWRVVEKIGVYDKSIQRQVLAKLGRTDYPIVNVQSGWYY